MRSRSILATFALLFALLLSLSTAASAHRDNDEIHDDLERTQQELESARAGLEATHAEVHNAKDALFVLDQRLTAMRGKLASLEADLAAKQTAFEEARAETDAVAAELHEANLTVSAAEEALQSEEASLRRRLVAAYKYGPLNELDALLDLKSATDLIDGAGYVRVLTSRQRGQVDRMEDQRADLMQARTKVGELFDVKLLVEKSAEQAKAAIEQITEEQRTVTAAVAADYALREHLVRELEADEAQYQQLVNELQAESDALARELRFSRWRAGAPGKGELVWPTDGYAGSGFGYRTHPIFGTKRFHSGVDISGPTGQPIIAAADGLVVHAGWRGGYGLAVVIDHGGGLATLYAHQSRIVVSENDVVQQGQKIGEIGSTGWSTGPHLHFEVRVWGEPQNPMDWY